MKFHRASIGFPAILIVGLIYGNHSTIKLSSQSICYTRFKQTVPRLTRPVRPQMLMRSRSAASTRTVWAATELSVRCLRWSTLPVGLLFWRHTGRARMLEKTSRLKLFACIRPVCAMTVELVDAVLSRLHWVPKCQRSFSSSVLSVSFTQTICVYR